MPKAAGSDGIAAALSAVMRDDHGRLTAVLIRQLGDFQLAEDCLQEAMTSALEHWHRGGVPGSPAGWLLKVARRKAIDRLRHANVVARKGAEYEYLLRLDQDSAPDSDDIPDERLRLIFTCCHPALEPKTQVALTLRTIGGLTTPEIAAAFLDGEPAMGKRLTRAKAKIAASGIPFRIPGPDEWNDRLNAVLTVIYLIFNAGYSVGEGASAIRKDLCEEAIWLARMVDRLRAGEPEVMGLLALLLLTHGRAAARRRDGMAVPIDQQDRGLWNRAMLDEGQDLLDRAVAALAPGPFQIKAAISACHLETPSDWRQIVLLYDRLYQMEPTPVVALNRLVALSELAGPEAALAGLDALSEQLAGYQPFHAAQAMFLARAGQKTRATAAFDTALSLTTDPGDRAFLAAERSRLCSA